MCQKATVITIPADVMQDHLDGNHTLRVNRFELNTHELTIDWQSRRHCSDEPSVDYDIEVDADLEYHIELDEYVHVDIYDDHTEQMAKVILEQKYQIDLLLDTVRSLREELKKKPFWKFW